MIYPKKKRELIQYIEEQVASSEFLTQINVVANRRRGSSEAKIEGAVNFQCGDTRAQLTSVSRCSSHVLEQSVQRLRELIKKWEIQGGSMI